MGRMDVSVMRYLEGEHFRILVAVEMGMKNHEMVPLALIAAIARIHRGAVSKVCSDLCKHSLLAFERGKKYDGYRLTVRGYDFLALRALCARGIVGSVGNQIGVGKESDVYVGGDAQLEDLVLKFHRLGRTSFRKVKEKRDYHQKRKSPNWLYLSRLAAHKEFAFLSALGNANFPVPKPLDVCRHVVVMGLIDGRTLCDVDTVDDVPLLYHKLMSLIVKFASHGLIHGDFNEFNIMLHKDDKVIVIDFPQMISTDHPNAEMYFNRDVQCIRTFFKRKFSFDCDEFPKLEECTRRHNLDVELEASGFTKAMAKDLNKAYNEGRFDVHLEDDEEDTSSGEESEEDAIREDDEERDLEELEEEERLGRDTKQRMNTSSRFESWLREATDQLDKVVMEEGEEGIEVASYMKTVEGSEERGAGGEEEMGREEEEEGGEQEETRRSTKKKGTRSIASTTTTIPPEEVKRRVAMELRKQKAGARTKAKGKQSAVSRGRKNNKETIAEYAGWDF